MATHNVYVKRYLYGFLFILTFLPLFAMPSIKYEFEAENAQFIGFSLKVADAEVSGGYRVNMTTCGDGIVFSKMPISSKLAIHYTSMSVGTINVTVNNQSPVKVNIHSSGAQSNVSRMVSKMQFGHRRL